jgi:FkbM family methyltransferase
LRALIVGRGIEMVCGRANTIDAAIATDIPLLSSAARMAWLKLLSSFGRQSFVTRSGLGYDFVCHVGDLAAFPYYFRRAYQAELQICADWIHGDGNPIVYDVGANCGFFSGHLAQMLSGNKPTIYAFEPVPDTFTKLDQTVKLLGLTGRVHPIAAAVNDRPGSVRVSYSERNSLEAQVTAKGLNRRVGTRLATAEAITLDEFYASSKAFPTLMKIDVEGSEVAVLRGARDLLRQEARPAILFEHNPITLAERGTSVRELIGELTGYALYYVDDLRGQMFPFGHPIREAERIDWICNLFAVPLTETGASRWARVLNEAAARIAGGNGQGARLDGALEPTA